ncbi:hypothetical protein S245_006243 [Arachis hypogaea]
MKFGMGTLDDMNHLKNKRIRSVADLLQDQFGLALVLKGEDLYNSKRKKMNILNRMLYMLEKMFISQIMKMLSWHEKKDIFQVILKVDGVAISRKKWNTTWSVIVVDEQGVEKSMHLKVKDAFSLHHSRKRVLIEWNGSGQPIGESGGLLGGILGLIASNFNNFSIMYKTWHKVPMQYKDAIFENTIKKIFVVNDDEHKRYILSNLGNKWKNNRFKLFNEHYKSELSWDANVNLNPIGIPKDHWAAFLEYRLSPKTQKNLQKEIGEGASENEAYVKVFGKENSSYVRGMGVGVRPSQMIRSLSCSRESMQSTTTSGPSRTEYQNLKLQVQLLQEQVNFLVNHQKGQLPPGFPTEVADFESPTHTRPYSSANHEPQQHRPSNV